MSSACGQSIARGAYDHFVVQLLPRPRKRHRRLGPPVRQSM